MLATTTRQALVAALLAAGGGAWWILATHETDPVRGLHYHVPLAAIFAAWCVECLHRAIARRGLLPLAAPAAGLAASILRLLGIGPLSGHAVIGGLLWTSTSPRWLRLLGPALILQALITKFALGEDPLSAVWGALAGLALGGLLRAPTASKPETDGGEAAADAQGRIANSIPARRT